MPLNHDHDHDEPRHPQDQGSNEDAKTQRERPTIASRLERGQRNQADEPYSKSSIIKNNTGSL